jgi:hypothetical protein
MGTLDPLSIADVLEVSKFPTHEPTKVQGHKELDTDGSENKDEREVEDNVGSDTTDRDTVDESDLDDIDQTVDIVVVACSLDKRGDIETGKGFVSSRHGVKERGEADLGGR